MVERVMSTLNLALQNVSLAWEEMDPHLEEMVWYKASLSQLHEAISKQSPSLEVTFHDSMSPLVAFLARRFSQIKLKEPITCNFSATIEEISECF